MSKPKLNNIEMYKNIILVALFFSTMLLLYFFWGSPIQANFRIAELIGGDTYEIPSYKDVSDPGRIVVNLGGGNYTVLDNDGDGSWDNFLEILKGLNKDDIISIEEITPNQFDKIMEFTSIIYRFYYSIPREDFAVKFQIQSLAGIEQISEFSLIGYSSGSPESLFLANELSNKYYRIVSAKPYNEIETMLSGIEHNKSHNYLRIGDAVGTTNRTVIPLSLKSTLSEVKYHQEFEDLNSETVKEFAQTFFGESLDFVRQIQGSKGTHIFMYGYGEKVLTISPRGRVEFKNKELPQGSQQNQFEALDTALQYVTFHGGWGNGKGVRQSPKIQTIKPVENNKQKGYRIIFEMKAGDNTIYHSGSHSIMVEVIHGQVTQYLRDMLIIDEEDYKLHKGGPLKEAYSAINIIAQNYQLMAQVLKEQGENFGPLEGEELFDAITEKLIFIKIGYVRPKFDEDESNELIPVWTIRAGDCLFYFNLYDATPLGYTEQMEF